MYQWRVSIPHLIYAPRGCAGIWIGSMSAMQTRIPRQDSRASLEGTGITGKRAGLKQNSAFFGYRI
ncbi:hypothetical protein [Anaerostipes sp.]|uniref:hypothetical protein n=1 Tax=Anaerostipes sp. TaxID=1872530 RepID=UPI002588E5FB|nr:hypothetical protein [Anaerostipes sp.]MDY2725268.1 hypothetical protein [Anaerostipes faecalis]